MNRKTAGKAYVAMLVVMLGGALICTGSALCEPTDAITITVQIREAPLRVVFPTDTGVILQRKQKCVIQWESYGLSEKDKIKIQLHKGPIDGGQTWDLTTSTANKKGEWKWTVGNWKKSKYSPTGYPNGDDFRIRIVKVNKDKSEDASTVAYSENLFTIGGVGGIGEPADDSEE